ncbi:hypothetical protein D3C85_1480590 [compost metagenome]
MRWLRPFTAHPGEGRDPDHMAERQVPKGGIAPSAIGDAPYNLDPGLRRDERIEGWALRHIVRQHIAPRRITLLD